MLCSSGRSGFNRHRLLPPVEAYCLKNRYQRKCNHLATFRNLRRKAIRLPGVRLGKPPSRGSVTRETSPSQSLSVR